MKRGWLLASFQRGRHRTLLISFLLLFIIVPFVYSTHYGAIVIAITGAIVMLSGLYALSARKGFFVVAFAGAVTVIIIDCWMVARPGNGIATVSDALTLLLFAMFAVAILGDVLRPGKISSNKIYGAICVYLSLGFVWAFAYTLLSLHNPGAFGGLSPTEPDHVDRVLELRYFSFITLATVGYGDIVPRSLAARTLATLEAIVGQFYLAILIARLVGLHIIHSVSEKD